MDDKAVIGGREFLRTYKGTLLDCAPVRLPNGHWEARLVVHDSHGGQELELAVATHDYVKDSLAANAAFGAGKHWVDAHWTPDSL